LISLVFKKRQIAFITLVLIVQNSLIFSLGYFQHDNENINSFVTIIIANIISLALCYFALKAFTRIQLRKSFIDENSFLNDMINVMPDRVFVKDENFRVIKGNKHFFTLYPPEQRDSIIGTTTVENFPEDEAKEFLKNDQYAFDHGTSQVLEDLTIYNGQVISLLTTKIRFQYLNQNYILGIARDITDLIDIQKGLEKKISARTKEYKDQKLIAENAYKAKEDFLASMSHELRTPLNSIIGITDILIDEGGFDNDKKKSLNTIQKASKILLRTVNDILDISKIESGKDVFENNPISLKSIMYSIIGQMNPLAESKGLKMENNLSEIDDVTVMADEYRVSKIIMNLLSNAIKYTDQGKVTTNIKYEKNQDTSLINFVIEVIDTGVGIPEDKIDTVFDKFSQIQRSHQNTYSGTGLGLYITKKLVEALSGEIEVKSKLNKGSAFKVTLPFSKAKKPTINKTDDKGKIKRNSNILKDVTVLIAEDHELNVILIEKILQRAGCTNYLIAENGEELIDLYTKNSADIILMDCHMPKLNGYEATKKVREIERRKDSKIVPIIAMTADVMTGAKDKCLDAGMNDYIAKPINEGVLVTIMQKWMNNADDALENQTHIDIQHDKKARYDMNVLKQYIEDESDISGLLDLFFNKAETDVSKLSASLSDKDKEEWTQAAHRLKGSCTYLGAGKLEYLCEVAQSYEDRNKQDKEKIYDKILKEFTFLKTELENNK